MIQPTRTDFAGYILGCRIHDLLHGLAIQKAKEDNFLMVCSKVEELQNCSHVRRLAIHDSNYERDEDLYCKIIPNQIPSLRSLFAKQLTSPMVPQHLKVWSDFYWISDTHVFKKIERLSQLRYLELTIQVKTTEEIRNFQEFIGGMRFLQTLDLQFSTIECDLPESLWHVKTLRNVILPFPKSSTNGPAPSLNLINLQTLRGVKCRESWGEEGIPNLPNLKSFAILASNRSQWNAIADLLYKLKNLIILSIHVDGISLNIIDMMNFPCYHHLQFLHLYGNGNKINLDQCLLPIHLNRLVLEHLQFQKDPMPVIEKFENLKFFWLKNCKIQQLCCLTTGCFGRLESLTLEELQELEEWKIEDGAMPVLKTLVVIACPRLHVPPGLQHLTVLQELTWDAKNNEISDVMENEIRSICKHVPAIKIIL
ncbi:Disease resistance protein (CC-NBS-LRR class) family [Rhynchospora pubera]|uniref:Disease resistance protein (CC-NBS-LRR class) family n=1 Tax=Rhynchospora pubera TaxID=906938 RepID=A0AAV8H9N1_9POAL|nr:Disease resistance protein (CC-NBS-LRR class) family [Rhynchospora pubera]